MALYLRNIESLKYSSKNFGSILKKNPQYGANEAGIDRQNSTETRYIRITDIDNYGLLKDKNLGKTAKNIEEQYLLGFNDLLLARSGSVGRAYLHKGKNSNSIFAGYLIRFIIDEAQASPDYIFYYMQLNIYKKWIDAIQRTVAQPNINAEEYKSLKIPMPPKNIQADIVAKMDKAYQDKKDKETQVQNLLNSIDDYLLDELGIDFPKQTDNSITTRIFTKKFSEVAGGRLDPDYHKPIYSVIDSALNNSKYEITNLDNISNNIFQGVGRNLTENTMHILLKVKNIAKNNEIRFDDVEYIDLYNNNKIKILKSGDIISPFIGEAIKQYKFSVFPELSKKYTVDNNTGVIRLFECANPIFISAFLMSFYGRKQIDRQLGGGGVPFIGTNGIKQLKIPLPPLEKQNQIAKRISKIRDQAKQLQTEAKTGLEQAKQEIETMILGGDL
ncbi:hypothetical protein [uncultured Gammaproteobacteria bacterium]|nr:hypothetical protein [uncultured Gammaproteobacteria bacterium]